MKLTDAERLTLINQYEILKGINEDRANEYDILIKCLSDGYLKDFASQAGRLEEELSDETRQEVRQILDMFRALTPKGGSPGHLKFAGFDGNDEAEHYAYASFLLKDLDLWRESREGELNSHTDMLPAYRKMLRLWSSWADQWNPTREELDAIIAVAPHLSKP